MTVSLLNELADFVGSARAGALPAHDRAVLRRHVGDVVAVRFAAAACAEGKAVAALYPPEQGPDSIAGLAALVRLTEADDIHLRSGTTPGSVVVPVALALADAWSCARDRLEDAIFVGIEMTVRAGMAAGGAHAFSRGIWPTRVGATIGAAATACRVWGLSAAATRNALSLATLLTTGRAGRFSGEPSGRWVVFAAAVAAGVRAADAARRGFSGDPAVVDAAWLERSLGVPVDAAELTRDLGRGSIFPQLSLKPYCTSRQALAGAEAMRTIVEDGLDPAAIQSFTIHVPTAYAAMIGQPLDPAIRATSYVSGAGIAAIAALDPDALYDLDRARALADPRIVALAAKGRVVADAGARSYVSRAMAGADRGRDDVRHAAARGRHAARRSRQPDR